jgi:release factor glutamine methyltransferase
LEKCISLIEWRIKIEETLSKANFPNAQLEAKWLLTNALEKENSFVTLNPSYKPSAQEGRIIQEWLRRRLADEPLSRIKGVREFWSLPFSLNQHTLDPRPETELIVEEVLKWVGKNSLHPWRLLDLGTGSGCILIALLYELKNATGFGVDRDEEALLMAQNNADTNGVGSRTTFLKNNWGKDLKGPFDIIVSNPPYIPSVERENLEKGVRDYDPSLALYGGKDGLDCYRILSHEIKPLMTPQSLAVLEMGASQRKEVEFLFLNNGFKTLFISKDLAGFERVIGFKI